MDSAGAILDLDHTKHARTNGCLLVIMVRAVAAVAVVVATGRILNYLGQARRLWGIAGKYDSKLRSPTLASKTKGHTCLCFLPFRLSIILLCEYDA